MEFELLWQGMIRSWCKGGLSSCCHSLCCDDGPFVIDKRDIQSAVGEKLQRFDAPRFAHQKYAASKVVNYQRPASPVTTQPMADCI